MKLTVSLALLIVPIITCQGATITLFAVGTTTGAPFPTDVLPSQTYIAIGVGADGATTYSNEAIGSVYLVQDRLNKTTFTSGGKTVTQTAQVSTITSNPYTFHATLVADASHFVYSQAPDPSNKPFGFIGNQLSCDFDGKGGAACVDKQWLQGSPTATSSYTGSVYPFYTLVTEDNQTGGNKGNAAGSLRLSLGLSVVVAGMLAGAFLVL